MGAVGLRLDRACRRAARRCGWGWLLLLLCLPAWAEVPVVEGPSSRGVAPSMQWLEDPGRGLTLSQVRSSAGWQGLDGAAVAFGVSPSAFWLRLRVHNPAATPRRWVLDLGNPQQDYVDWHVVAGDGRVQAEGETGDRRPFGTRPLPVRALAIPLYLPAGATHDVYLRLDSQGGWFDVLVPSLNDPDAWLLKQQRADFAQALYLGGMLLLVGLALTAFVLTRLPAAGWYLLYLLSLAVFFAGVQGFDAMYLWPDQPAWHNQSVLYAAQLCYLSGSLFIIEHQRLRQVVPARIWWVVRVLVAACLANLLLVAAGFGVWAIWGSLAGVLLTLICWGFALHQWRGGRRDAGYVVLGALAVLAGIACHYFALLGDGLPGGSLWPLQLGAAVQVGLMAVAVASAALHWRQDRARVQAEAEATHRRLTRELNHARRHDALTGLPNALALRDWLAARLQDETPLVLMHLGLERFADMPEVTAPEAGDRILQRIARVCAEAVGARGFAARWEGEQFVLVLDGSDRTTAEACARGLCTRLSALGADEGGGADWLPRLGAVAYPDDAWEPDALLRQAALAMRERRAPPGPLAWYLADRVAPRERRRELLRDLRQAIARRQLRLFYQPKQDLRDGGVGAVEALLRWQHPVHGWVSPAEFIPLAEMAGLMPLLTTWVVKEGLSQLASWNAMGEVWRVSVNVSAQDLESDSLARLLHQGLERYGVVPEQLVIEVTESAVMKDALQARRVMMELCGRGIAWSMDDFGTGHSSLATLRSLPFRELKIDKSFFDGLDAGAGDAVLVVRAIIELGHGLGMRVVAEGVETETLRDNLREWGCDEIQGYLLSRPLAADELLQWAREQRLVRAGPGKSTRP